MLTDTEAVELNWRGAVIMGWSVANVTDGLGRLYYQPPVSAVVCLLPDFCRDTHALGWMVEWLAARHAADPHFVWGLAQQDDGSYCGWVGTETSTFYCSALYAGESLMLAIETEKEAAAE